MPEDGRVRAVIDAVLPEVDGGRFAVKRMAGERGRGHGALLHRRPRRAARACCSWRAEGDADLARSADDAAEQRHLAGRFTPPAPGRYRYTVVAWVDSLRVVAPRADAPRRRRRHPHRGAGRRDRDRWPPPAARRAPTASTLTQLRARTARRPRSTARWTRTALKALALDEPLTEALAARYPDRRVRDALRRSSCRWWPTASARASAAGTSCSRARPAPSPACTARFSDVEARLPAIAEMGFDVLYFPPIHPIGRVQRKGKNNALVAEAERRRQPMGDRRRPKAATRRSCRQLGTVEDFRALVAQAQGAGHRHRAGHRLPVRARPPVREGASGLVPLAARRHRAVRREPAEEIPGHLPVQLRVRRLARPVGRAQERVRPLDRRGRERSSASTTRTPRRSRSGNGRSPRSSASIPESIFLAEAFTRPKVMHRLAKLGYLAVLHLLHLAQHQGRADRVLHRAVAGPGPRLLPPQRLAQHARHPARAAAGRRRRRSTCARLVLAATLAASYGIYGPAYELLEHLPREPGSEEYLDSEKYQLRTWDHDRARQPRALHRARQPHPPRQPGAAATTAACASCRSTTTS